MSGNRQRSREADAHAAEVHEDFEACYRAMSSRDARFDGRFFTGVTSTGIYCRPVCPAQTPRRANVCFYRTAAAAEAAGFRACRRCRPHLAPGLVQHAAGGVIAKRALSLLAAGAADRPGGIAAVAERLEVSDRHLHRVLREAVGAGPLTLARMRRLQAARDLIEQTTMPITDVAFSAGYSSLRQFNSEVRAGMGASPTELRRRGRVGPDGDGAVVLRLGVRPPFDAAALLAFFAARAVAGVEVCSEGSLTRSAELLHGAAVVQLQPDGTRLTARLWLDDVRDLGAAVEGCRRLFDVDADPQAIAAVLETDPLLSALVAARPGLRVPGAFGGDEIAIRAVLGQQVSVRQATALAARLCDHLGTPLTQPRHGVSRLFPSSAAVAGADLEGLGLTGERAATLRRVATALARGEIDLGPGADVARTREALLTIRGVGEWTASYIAMRALRDPDAFPAGDAGIRRGFAGAGGDPGRLSEHAQRWRPWRAYAAIHLWQQPSTTLEARS